MRRDAGGISRNGLRVDAAKDRDWRRRSAEKYAAKQRQRHNEARLTTRVPQKSSNDWPAKTRQLVKRRSGGWCEIGGSCRATDLHHRKPRRCRDHRPSNALHVCRRHHDELEHSKMLATARVNGWKVISTADPAVVSVLIASGERVLLTDDGRYEDAA